ncbi:MAG TPA: hypothetical protein VGK20_13135 [Candidatus Binatia bacterium]
MKPDRATVFAVAVLVAAVATTSFRGDFQLALSPLRYSQARTIRAFHGIDMDAMAAAMASRFSPAAPLVLGEDLAKNDFVVQRATEALYPRPVLTKPPGSSSATPAPAAMLVAGAAAHAPTPGALDVGRYRTGALYLVDQHAADPAQTPPDRSAAPSTLEMRVFSFLDSLFGAVGIGALLWVVLFRQRLTDTLSLPGVFVLLAAIAIAIKTELQSWLQLAWCGVFPGFGFLALIAASAAVLGRSPLKNSLAEWQAAARRPENFALPVFVVLLLLRQATLPIELWDGRSIWLFLARRIHVQGMLLKADLANPLTLWSHPDYPLLHPSWMSWFAGYESGFNERMAASGIAVLLAAIASLLWRMARSAFGRVAGASFTLSCVLIVGPLTVGGYADGILALLLAVEVLALASPDTRGNDTLWWIAAVAASLTKTEGLVLAPAVALPFLLLHPFWRARSPASRVAFAAALVPAMGQRLWTSLVGVNSIVYEGGPVQMLARLGPRLAEAVERAPRLWREDGYVHLRAALWIGLASLLVAAIGCAFGGRRDRPATMALAAALVAAAFAFVSIGGMPNDVSFLVGTALDRLLLHAAVLSVLAAQLMFAATEPVAEAAPKAPPQQPPATATRTKKRRRR